MRRARDVARRQAEERSRRLEQRWRRVPLGDRAADEAAEVEARCEALGLEAGEARAQLLERSAGGQASGGTAQLGRAGALRGSKQRLLRRGVTPTARECGRKARESSIARELQLTMTSARRVVSSVAYEVRELEEHAAKMREYIGQLERWCSRVECPRRRGFLRRGRPGAPLGRIAASRPGRTK